MRAITLDEFEEALQIDKNDLDEEVIRQPQLIYMIHKACAGLVLKRDIADKTVDDIKLDLDKQFRKQAEDAGEKLTETALTRRIADTKAVRNAEEALLKAKHELAVWEGMKAAIQDRSYELRQLVSLYEVNYYANDGMGKAGRDHKDAVADRVRRETGQQRSREKR